jgi:hypothetical protein
MKKRAVLDFQLGLGLTHGNRDPGKATRVATQIRSYFEVFSVSY